MAVKSRNGVVALALIATAIFLFSGSLTAQTFDYSIVHSFGAPRMGWYPSSPLLLDNKGNLYGATNAYGRFDHGLTYQINALGTERAVYSFSGGFDGWVPYAGLISDPDGNLYGVTSYGGDLTCNPPDGCGTIFKLDAARQLSVLHTLSRQEGCCAYYSGLVRDGSGNFYGSVYYGSSGYGMIYMLDPLGNFTVLHDFAGGADGSNPNGLMIDKAGNVYGTTYEGGSYGTGTVFKMDLAGHKSTLYDFAGVSDASYPVGTLARDSVGNVYGATLGGGNYRYGTLFQAEPTESYGNHITRVHRGR